MKRFFTFVAAAAFAMGLSAQSITVTKNDHKLANDYAAGCEVDIDNDGLKEIIIGGWPNWSDGEGMQPYGQTVEDENGDEVFVERATWILKWNGSDYTTTQFSNKGVFGIRSHVIPADFNGDGYVDLYIASGGDANTLNGLFLNDGNGHYTFDPKFQVLDEQGNPIVDEETGTQLRWLPRACDVADFNNDGLLDVVTCGWWLGAKSETAMCGVLVNNGDGTFSLTQRDLMGDGNMIYAFALCTIKAYDLNNDGWMDFVVQGNVDNYEEGDHKARTWMQFMNLAEDTDLSESPVGFYPLYLEDDAQISRDFGNGNFNIVDFNNDGTPDIFVTGENPDAHGGWAYWGQLLKGKLSGTDISYSEDNGFVARNRDIRPLNSNNIGTRAIDYNNDGYYDLFLFGWCESMLDGGNNTQSGWLLSGSEAGLTTYTRIPGASEQGIVFLDYGVQGALNYAFTGYHGDDTYFKDDGGRSMAFTKNPWTVASRPAAPGNPKVVVDGGKVTLSWSAAAGEKNNVTYEFYLKKDGKVYNGCTSFIGGDNDGVRKVLREGNACMNKTITLNLADGNYEWGVQTVNAAQRGSVFAKGDNFTVVGAGISDIKAETVGKNVMFNIAGQRVNSNYKGVVVKNGAKMLQK